MNKFICQNLFTSPHTGRTYNVGDVIDQYEYDRLSYSDSRRFTIKPNEQSFAFQASNSFSVNLGIPF
jgi:hypothetical protein